MTSFSSFGLPSFLSESLSRLNISIPTPIQQKAIPFGLEGRDILGSAQTGTGKTMAYLLPLLTNLLKDETSSALILAPTRELAAQIQESARALLGKQKSVGMALLIGGASMSKQILDLKKQPRLIIGTPGRIIDHLTRRTLRLHETRFLVLDETDRMLDMGFSEALKKIIGHLSKERQTFMFSATMPPSIKTLSLTYLTNPQHISIGSTITPSVQITQEMVKTSANEKYPMLLKELDQREGSIIVFVKTKHGAERLATKLNGENHLAAAIHGDLKQRKREEVIRNFRNLKHRIVVATDLAARGLDIPHIKHVINFDLPQCAEDYIHRIGRTGRAGMEGSALSFISPEDGQKWRRIQNLMDPANAQPVGPDKPQRRSNSRPFQKSESSKKGKPFRGSKGPREDKPFRTSAGSKEDKPFRKPESSRGEKPFRSSEGPREGKSFRNSERPGGEKPFRSSEGPREGKPFRKSESARGEKSFRSSERPKEGKSFRKSESVRGEKPFRSSEGAKADKPFRSADGQKQGKPFRSSENSRGGKSFRGSEFMKRSGTTKRGASPRRQASYG
jgi:ATP-dependent RNA helicase DeaD